MNLESQANCAVSRLGKLNAEWEALNEHGVAYIESNGPHMTGPGLKLWRGRYAAELAELIDEMNKQIDIAMQFFGPLKIHVNAGVALQKQDLETCSIVAHHGTEDGEAGDESDSDNAGSCKEEFPTEIRTDASVTDEVGKSLDQSSATGTSDTQTGDYGTTQHPSATTTETSSRHYPI